MHRAQWIEQRDGGVGGLFVHLSGKQNRMNASRGKYTYEGKSLHLKESSVYFVIWIWARYFEMGTRIWIFVKLAQESGYGYGWLGAASYIHIGYRRDIWRPDELNMEHNMSLGSNGDENVAMCTGSGNHESTQGMFLALVSASSTIRGLLYLTISSCCSLSSLSNCSITSSSLT